MKIREDIKESNGAYIDFWGDITRIMQELMGKSVVKAELLLGTKYDNDSKKAIFEIANGEGRRIEKRFEKKKILDISSTYLKIEYVGGYLVTFFVSEDMLMHKTELDK